MLTNYTYSAVSYFCFKIAVSADFSLIDFVKIIGEYNKDLNGKVSVIILFLCFQNIQVLEYVPSSHSSTIDVSSKLFTLPICGINSLYLSQQTATKLPTTGVGVVLPLDEVQILFEGVGVAGHLREDFLPTSI